jgi:hypothetical protein
MSRATTSSNLMYMEFKSLKESRGWRSRSLTILDLKIFESRQKFSKWTENYTCIDSGGSTKLKHRKHEENDYQGLSESIYSLSDNEKILKWWQRKKKIH